MANMNQINLSGLSVFAHVARHRSFTLLPNSCPDYPGWYLYFPSRRHMPARLRAFIDFFRAANAPPSSHSPSIAAKANQFTIP